MGQIPRSTERISSFFYFRTLSSGITKRNLKKTLLHVRTWATGSGMKMVVQNSGRGGSPYKVGSKTANFGVVLRRHRNLRKNILGKKQAIDRQKETL